MARLNSFCPNHLAAHAEESGFFQCPKCGLIWFGRPDIQRCPDGPHGLPVRVVVLCRVCDADVPADKLLKHLSGESHKMCAEDSD